MSAFKGYTIANDMPGENNNVLLIIITIVCIEAPQGRRRWCDK